MAKPRYLALADQIAAAIENGKLAPGTRLPTHRAFATQFGVALATATRTYGELERRGIVVGEAGRGTFVRDMEIPLTIGMQQTAPDGQVDLVFNMPSATGDAEMLRAGLRRLALTGDIEAMLRYQPHGGRPHERRIMAGWLEGTLGAIDPDHLLVTSGGQHGLTVTLLGLLKHGDIVAADPLTYPGFKSLAALQGIDLLAVDGAGGVMDPDRLDAACKTRPVRAVYLMPTVQNPLGTVMDLPTRLRIIEVARKHDLLIIEDAAYAFLECDPPPSLCALAPERTVHIGGFSKSLATGLRLGYVIAAARHCPRLIEAIRATTWNAPALISALVTGWITDGTLAQSQDTRRQDGAARQQLLRAAFGTMLVLSHPNAGFAWVPLSAGGRAEPIVTRLKSQGLSLSGADAFATTAAVPQALRLAFGGMETNAAAKAFGIIHQSIQDAGTLGA
ncbi:PLP-dependent aminotransferase family protein [Phaeobacter porticola]|uniref:Transcriptional regulator n=1 Tax=Phaeobacter porticola TaxID=1844006 RepID=A0A1L3I670_9RHOB|nr:PLP-dependent aminotransferase family protein [Phaeobacter porticola]APG47654.1 Transcriptional regulator [Phaeobacter porticola]